MNIDDLMNAAPGISPEKLEFLKAFANMPTGSNSAAMMRQLANCQRQAKEQNIQFTPNPAAHGKSLTVGKSTCRSGARDVKNDQTLTLYTPPNTPCIMSHVMSGAHTEQ